jgi:hypothetical protein
MSAGLEGTSVPPEADRGGRPTLTITETVAQKEVLVAQEFAPLGFEPPEQALHAGRAFARELGETALLVKPATRELGGQPAAPAEPSCPRPAGAPRMCEHSLPFEPDDPGLRLTPQTSRDVLRKLRKLGRSLREPLSEDFLGQLRKNGFLAGRAADQEPALTFVHRAKVPILWDMLYDAQDEEPGEVDWERFWGFRVPITHWVPRTRTGEIRLQRGLSAAAEELPFSGLEILHVAKQVEEQGLHHATLADALYEYARGQLRGESGDCCPREKDWLCSYLKRFEDRDGWKEKALANILGGARYDLFHFACHCEADPDSEFLSCLRLTVAGERLALDVASLPRRSARPQSDGRPARPQPDDPGPLVFLNACRTGGGAVLQEPPGFPSTWIEKQGALAVLATICPVPDYFAQAFALHFYQHLFAERPGPDGLHYVAEALLATRRDFMREYHNPLGLAYILYAAHGARVIKPGGRS